MTKSHHSAFIDLIIVNCTNYGQIENFTTKESKSIFVADFFDVLQINICDSLKTSPKTGDVSLFHRMLHVHV